MRNAKIETLICKDIEVKMKTKLLETGSIGQFSISSQIPIPK